MLPSERRTTYPEIQPFRSDFFATPDGHRIYFEQCGNPKGKPVIFLHGGPGAGCAPAHRQFFHPEKYHIILMDQRGAGKSTPFASLENNTSWKLIEDIEYLRKTLNISHWQVFGGSWGSTLALAYAITHPERVSELILRGIFLCRPRDIEWFYQSGADFIFPDQWERYIAPVAPQNRHHMVKSYYELLCSSDESIRDRAALAWSEWEGSTYKLLPGQDAMTQFSSARFALSLARIECHYFVHNAFFDSANWIIENAPRISQIPGVIIHGRYDIVCPIDQAWALHKAWPRGDLQIIADAGHAASEPGITDALVRATDLYANRVSHD